MTKTYRELTGKKKRQIKKLVVSKCANYDKEYGCLPFSWSPKSRRLFGERRSSGVSELFVPARKRAIPSLRRRVSAICSGYATHAVGCASGFGKLCCQPCRSCKPYSSRYPLRSVRNAASTFRRTVNMPTVPTSAPQMQDASKRRQECESTEKRSVSKTLCNELASEMP